MSKLFCSVIVAIVCVVCHTMSGCHLQWTTGCCWFFKFFFHQDGFDVWVKGLLRSWSLWAWL